LNSPPAIAVISWSVKPASAAVGKSPFWAASAAASMRQKRSTYHRSMSVRSTISSTV